MKKLVSFTLIVLVIFSITACAIQESSNRSSDNDAIIEQTEDPEQTLSYYLENSTATQIIDDGVVFGIIPEHPDIQKMRGTQWGFFRYNEAIMDYELIVSVGDIATNSRSFSNPYYYKDRQIYTISPNGYLNIYNMDNTDDVRKIEAVPSELLIDNIIYVDDRYVYTQACTFDDEHNSHYIYYAIAKNGSEYFEIQENDIPR